MGILAANLLEVGRRTNNMKMQKAWASINSATDHPRKDPDAGYSKETGYNAGNDTDKNENGKHKGSILPTENPLSDRACLMRSEQQADLRKEAQPWLSPRTVIQQNERDCYELLKDRLACIPSRSRQKRQTLYIDLWTGQHWLGITLSYPEGYEILKPVSVDTALSIATIGSYRLLNQPLFEDRYSGKLINS